MVCCLKAKEFKIEYTESEIEEAVLWESHCHTQFELIAVAVGDVSVMLEGKNHRLKEGQVLIIPPLHYHSVTANGKGKYSRVTALFDSSAIPSVLKSEFEGCGTGIEISESDVIERIKKICLKENTDFYLPLVKSLMVEIFYEALEGRTRHTEAESDGFLDRALEYIDKHLSEKILLDDLAKHTARSKSSFCHLFLEKMNISPKQYILEKKLALAEKLIEEGLSHTEAAIRVGYSNYSDFYRVYKKKKEMKR